MTLLAERGTPVGPEGMIERVERELAGQPHVVVSGQREGYEMTKTQERVETGTLPAGSRNGVARYAGWKVAFASFAIILLAAGGLWFASRDTGSGEVAGDPPTTNAPANDREQIALDTMVAFYTGNEARFLALSTTTDPVELAEGTRDLRLDRALNTGTESIVCATSGPTNISVSCEFLMNSDLLAALGIEDHLVEATVTVLDGGWKIVQFDLRFETEPIFESFWNDTDSGLFDEGGLCFWRPNIDVAAVDWDACAEAWVPFAAGFAADYGR